jgi:RNA polymerase sigma-70 factor (ECF subfamily)
MENARDLEWLRLSANGDRPSFERLYLRYCARLGRFVARHTRHRHLVDEIVNETMWVVWRTAGEFRGDSKVGTWIIGIAYRCLLKALRDYPASGPRQGDDADGSSLDSMQDEVNETERNELRDWVRHGLDLLPREQRITMELVYYLGQNYEEIAVIMDCAVGTVKARMFHARVRLRNTLPALGGDTGMPRTERR